jgi:hypothetical protein
VVRCKLGNAYILKTLLGEEFTATINGRYLIVVPSVRETEIVGIREEAAFRTKIPTKGKWPILKCIALSTKLFFCITNVLAGSSINNTTT